VHHLGRSGRGDPRGETAAVTDGGPDLDRVVAALCAASAGVTPARRPWTPPLPDRVELAEVSSEPGPPGDEPPLARLAIGLRDLPGEQRRAALHWDLARGPLLVVGAPRTGRTSTLLAVVAAAASRSPAAVHVYLVAPPSPVLAGVGELPQVGAVVDPSDAERLRRLLRQLDALVRRRRRGAAAGPTTLVLVDGADRLLADAAAALAPGDDDVGELLLRLLTDGPAVGVVTAVTGDRSLLLSRCAPLVPQRLLLALADAGDAVLAGVPARAVPRRMPPGRALVVGDDEALVTEAQVASVGGARDSASRRAGVDELAAWARARWGAGPGPWRVPEMPGHVRVTAVLDAGPCGEDAGPQRGLLLGIGGEAVEPLAHRRKGERPLATTTTARPPARAACPSVTRVVDRPEPGGPATNHPGTSSTSRASGSTASPPIPSRRLR